MWFFFILPSSSFIFLIKNIFKFYFSFVSWNTIKFKIPFGKYLSQHQKCNLLWTVLILKVWLKWYFWKKKFRLKFIRSSGRLNNTPHPPPPSMPMSLFLVPMNMSLYMANGLLQMRLHYDLEIRLPWVGAYVIIRVPLSGRQEAQVASGKEPASQWRRHKRTRVPSLGWEDPLKEETAAHASLLTWRLPWSEEPAGLQSLVSQRTWHNWSDLARIHRRLRVRKDMRIKANRERLEDATLLTLKMEEGDSTWGMQAVFRSWKMQRGRLTPRASGRNAALLTPWL